MIPTDPPRRIEGLVLEDYEAPLGDYLAAGAREEIGFGPTSSIRRMLELGEAEKGRVIGTIPTESETDYTFRLPPDSPTLSPEAATEKYKHLGLSFKEPIPERAAEIMARRKKAEVARQSLIRRGPSGIVPGTLALTSRLLATAADPLNIAAAFVPVVREARFAAWAGRFGVTGARAAKGFAEGAAGAIAVEPFVYAATRQEQADYDMADSLLNVAFGSILGGGLHVGGGALADVVRLRTGRPTLKQRLQATSFETRETALRTAVGQMAQGKFVHIDDILGLDPGFTPRLMETTSLTPSARPEIDLSQIDGTPPSKVDTPIKTDAAQGSMAYIGAKGQEVVFASEIEAQRFAAKKRRREGLDLKVAERDDGFGFDVGLRAVPLRDPDGSLTSFATERAARKHIDRIASLRGRDLEIVPHGEIGNIRQIIVEGATESEIGAMRKAPHRTRFPEPAGRPDPDARRALAIALERESAPEKIAIADFDAAIRADATLKIIPENQNSETAQSALDDVMQEIDAVRGGLGLDEEMITRELADADAGIREAEDFGKAIRAAAICFMRKA